MLMNSTLTNKLSMIRIQSLSSILIFFLAIGSGSKAQQPPATQPAGATAQAQAAPLTRAQLVDMIKNTGGTVKTEGDAPDGAIVEITLVDMQHCGGIFKTSSTAQVGAVMDMRGKPGSSLDLPAYITDDLLAQIQGFPKLTHLNVTMCAKVTDAGVKTIGGLSSLQQLDLSGTQITDSGLENLKGLNNLQRLDLNETQISDAGLARLEEMKQLQSLGLMLTPITDAGLEHLKGLTGLKALYVLRTKATEAGVAALQTALPGCTIYYAARPQYQNSNF